MNYLSKNTEKIIEIIDDLNELNRNFEYTYFTPKTIKPFYDSIYKLYQNLNFDIISKEITNINTSDFCGIFDLLEYLLENNFIDDFKNLKYDETENTSLHNIIKNKEKEKCKIWINLNGKNLLRKLFFLKDKKEIPSNLFDKLSIIDNDLLTEFTPFDIIEYLGESNLIKYVFNLKYFDTTISLKIVTKNSLKKPMLYRLINNILLMIALKNQKEKHNGTISIVLVLTNYRKKLPTDYKVLGPREINSGVCMFRQNKILIFRREEFEKLIIHELCHLLYLDLSVIDIPNITNIVNINPNTEFRINESLTETISLIIHSIVVSINLSTKKNYRLASTLINYEINFNLIQVAKILNHYGFKNANDFFTKYHIDNDNDNGNDNDNDNDNGNDNDIKNDNDNDIKNDNDNEVRIENDVEKTNQNQNEVQQKSSINLLESKDKFKQTTSVLSYYIIKTAVFYNKYLLHQFFKENFVKYNYINKDESINKYIDLVIKSLQNKYYQNSVDFLMKNMQTKNKYFLETLRMSCIEMD